MTDEQRLQVTALESIVDERARPPSDQSLPNSCILRAKSLLGLPLQQANYPSSRNQVSSSSTDLGTHATASLVQTDGRLGAPTAQANTNDGEDPSAEPIIMTVRRVALDTRPTPALEAIAPL